VTFRTSSPESVFLVAYVHLSHSQLSIKGHGVTSTMGLPHDYLRAGLDRIGQLVAQ
jgi:hypothetical protein